MDEGCYDIDNIPIQIEGVNLSSLPSTSSGQVPNDQDDSSDDNAGVEKPIIRKDVSKLSPHLKGLMGEANVRFARGDLETSKKMCFEVIRQVRDAYEPYLTLCQMYENTNPTKYKAYLMLATHLAPTDTGVLSTFAELHIQEGKPEEALKCYSKAIRYDPKNLALHEKRLELLEKLDKKQKLVAKQTLASNVSKKHYEIILRMSMEAAQEHYKDKNYARAVEALMVPFKRIPNKVTNNAINMILELLILCERYSECLDIFTHLCGFTFDITLTEQSSILINSYEKPEDLHVDLKFKFVVCLVRLRAEHIFMDLINDVLIQDDVENVGDLYLDVIEALMAMSYPYEALKLLVPMVKSKAYSTAAVWLKYAECFQMCDMPEQAIEAYFTVMSMAPSHVEVLYPLAMLLLQQNKKQEALEVMSQDLSTNKLDVGVLLEQMKLLKQINDWDAYWKSVELLLSRHCVVLKYPEELDCVARFGSIREKINKIRTTRSYRKDDSEVERNYISLKEPTVSDEYDIYRNILQLAMDRKEYGVFQKFAFMGLCSKRFQKYFKEIYLVTAFACILCDDYDKSYRFIREILLKNTNNELIFNWFILITTAPAEMRYIRFMMRYSSKFSMETRNMMIANNHLSVGNYITALNFFVREYKKTGSVYSAFAMAVAMLQYYQRKIEKDNKKIIAETVTYLFFNYAKLRTKTAEQEVFYNLGRMYHQLGIMYLAEYYYKKALKVNNKFTELYPEIVCLKREAAFNLHLIYKNGGNFTEARRVLYEYIVI